MFNILPSTGQKNNTAQPQTYKWFSLTSSLINGITIKKLQAVLCPNKQRSFEPFMCLDLVFSTLAIILVFCLFFVVLVFKYFLI